MNYSELLESSYNQDLDRRRTYLEKRTDKELAMTAASPVSDYRDAEVAKQLLRNRGVQGVPES